jgi:hypothetical protein
MYACFGGGAGACILLQDAAGAQADTSIYQVGYTTITMAGFQSRDALLAPRTAAATLLQTPLAAGTHAILADNNSALVIAGWVAQGATVEGETPLSVTSPEAADLAARVYESFSAEHASDILSELLGKYAAYLYAHSIEATAVDLTLTFQGETLLDCITLLCWFAKKVCYWTPAGAVYFDDADVDTTTNVTGAAVGPGATKVVWQQFNRVDARGAVSGGAPLASVKTAADAGHMGWRTVPYACSAAMTQATIDALATAVLAAVSVSAYRVSLVAYACGRPQVGQTLGLTYNVSPISLAAETALVVAEALWDEDTGQAGLTLDSALALPLQSERQVLADVDQAVANAAVEVDANLTDLLASHPYAIPASLVTGYAGFVDSANYGACLDVAYSDASAYACFSFYVGAWGTRQFKLLLAWEGSAIATLGGLVYLGEDQDGESGNYELLNAVNGDVSIGAANTRYIWQSAAFTAHANHLVIGFFLKDDNMGGVSGTLHFYGAWLIPQ